jgi:hypothetical protein
MNLGRVECYALDYFNTTLMTDRSMTVDEISVGSADLLWE